MIDPQGRIGQETYLVVLHGRFLPVEELEMKMDHNIETAKSFNGNMIQYQTGSTCEVEFTTPRNPMMMDTPNGRMFIIDSKRMTLLDDFISTSSHPSHDMPGLMEVEGIADKVQTRER